MSYDKICENACPDYLAMGMTWDEYWNGDPEMTRAFRKAYRMKREQRNFDSWLQGMYIYEALLDVSPMFHDLVKDPKPVPYPEKPYALTADDRKKRAETEEEEQDKKNQEIIRAWASRVNRIEAEKAKKGVQADGRQ